MLFVAFVASLLAQAQQEIPPNTWVRIADCPGDAEGREVPPGRAATWCYEPVKKVFLRYGGVTPRFSNALDQFDPATGKWKRLVAEDENYPDDRPGGGCGWAICYDATSKLVWLGGGLAAGYTGSRGIWSYNPASGKFACVARENPNGVGRVCFDPINGLCVAQHWPRSSGLGTDGTMVCPLATGKWERLSTPENPQPTWGGHAFAMTFDPTLGRVVVVDSDNDKSKSVLIWSFDGAGRKWEKLEAGGGPSARQHTLIASDPDRKVILLHGVHPGGQADANALNDTWVLDPLKKEWKEIKTPGPTPMKNSDGGVVTLYRQALAYDTDRKRFTLAEPDLGVWVLRYDPAAPAGQECVANGFVPLVGRAATNAPAEGAADRLKEVRRVLPSPLNPRILAMADNTILPLGGGVLQGDEIGWCYDPDAGVFAKYGGCGNYISQYWGGYGNSLALYDPGTERWSVRRASDIAGGMRPMNGCTRSIVHDSGRKALWFFGGAASGPFSPWPSPPAGFFAYDIRTDRFSVIPGTGTPSGHDVVLEEDPDHLVAISPQKDKTMVFDMRKAAWETKDTPGFNGGHEYRRMAYVTSRKMFLALDVAGENEKIVNRTMAYDPVTGTWTDLAPREQPPSRADKYGMVYDSRNDVVIVLGGGWGWNKGWRNDMWAYIVRENRWEKITPKLAGDARQLPAFTDNMPSGYDSRHNAVIFLEGNSPWAYRYRK